MLLGFFGAFSYDIVWTRRGFSSDIWKILNVLTKRSKAARDAPLTIIVTMRAPK